MTDTDEEFRVLKEEYERMQFLVEHGFTMVEAAYYMSYWQNQLSAEDNLENAKDAWKSWKVEEIYGVQAEYVSR